MVSFQTSLGTMVFESEANVLLDSLCVIRDPSSFPFLFPFREGLSSKNRLPSIAPTRQLNATTNQKRSTTTVSTTDTTLKKVLSNFSPNNPEANPNVPDVRFRRSRDESTKGECKCPPSQIERDLSMTEGDDETREGEEDPNCCPTPDHKPNDKTCSFPNIRVLHRNILCLSSAQCLREIDFLRHCPKVDNRERSTAERADG